MLLYGKNPVLERIKSAPGTIKELYLQKRTDLSEIVREAKAAGLAFESVERAWLENRCADAHTQGVAAEVRDFQYTPFPSVLERVAASEVVPVFLDGVTDPQNLGGIIRSLACMGGFAVVLPEHGSAGVNGTVLRVASGGESHLSIATVPNIATAIRKMQSEGVTIAGAVAEGGEEAGKVELKFPLGLVLGAEGKGIRPGVKKCLDIHLSLPMRGAPLSFNVSVAAALICYEVRKRIGPGLEQG